LLEIWKRLFSDEQLKVIESIDTADTLVNLDLLLKLVMASLHRELEEGRDSTNSIRLFDIARRLLEDIADEKTLEDTSVDDFKKLLEDAQQGADDEDN